MKDGAVLANAGHFDVELDLAELSALAVDVRDVRPLIEQYELEDGRRLNLLARGRVVNLAAGEGHPAAVMDVSFALQALCVEDLVRRRDEIAPGVQPVPESDRSGGRHAQAGRARGDDRRADARAAAIQGVLGVVRGPAWRFWEDAGDGKPHQGSPGWRRPRRDQDRGDRRRRRQHRARVVAAPDAVERWTRRRGGRNRPGGDRRVSGGRDRAGRAPGDRARLARRDRRGHRDGVDRPQPSGLGRVVRARARASSPSSERRS